MSNVHDHSSTNRNQVSDTHGGHPSNNSELTPVFHGYEFISDADFLSYANYADDVPAGEMQQYDLFDPNMCTAPLMPLFGSDAWDAPIFTNPSKSSHVPASIQPAPSSLIQYAENALPVQPSSLTALKPAIPAAYAEDGLNALPSAVLPTNNVNPISNGQAGSPLNPVTTAGSPFWGQVATILCPVSRQFITGPHQELVTNKNLASEVIRLYQEHEAQQKLANNQIQNRISSVPTLGSSCVASADHDNQIYQARQPAQSSEFHATRLSGSGPLSMGTTTTTPTNLNPAELHTDPAEPTKFFECPMCLTYQEFDGVPSDQLCVQCFNQMEGDVQQTPNESTAFTMRSSSMRLSSSPNVNQTEYQREFPSTPSNGIARYGSSPVGQQSHQQAAGNAVGPGTTRTIMPMSQTRGSSLPAVPAGCYPFQDVFATAEEARQHIICPKAQYCVPLGIQNDDWHMVKGDTLKKLCAQLFIALQKEPAAAPENFTPNQKRYYNPNQQNAFKQCKSLLSSTSLLTLASARIMVVIDEVVKLHKYGIPQSTLDKLDAQVNRSYEAEKSLKCQARIELIIDITHASKYVALDILRGKNVEDMVRSPNGYGYRKLVNSRTNAKRSKGLGVVRMLANNEDVSWIHEDEDIAPRRKPKYVLKKSNNSTRDTPEESRSQSVTQQRDHTEDHQQQDQPSSDTRGSINDVASPNGHPGRSRAPTTGKRKHAYTLRSGDDNEEDVAENPFNFGGERASKRSRRDA